MTKITSAFGNISSLRTKTFELGGHEFKVRVPLSKELEELNQRVRVVPEDHLKERYEKAVAGFLTGDPIDGVEIKDDDVIVDGRSTKEIIQTSIQVENRIVEYFRLLVSQNGDVNDITYEDIDAELPFSVQIELLEMITQAIQPGYKDSRKN